MNATETRGAKEKYFLTPYHAIAVHLTIVKRRYAVANVVIPDTDKPALKSEKFPIHYFR